MAVTAQLVSIGHNSLRYLITQDGAAGSTLTITSTGAATPDLLTDSVAGPIKRLAKVIADGFGTFAAGVQTQAKARALWNSDFSAADPTSGDPSGSQALLPTAVLSMQSQGSQLVATVDANIDGSGNPILTVTMIATATRAFLDVAVPSAIGA